MAEFFTPALYKPSTATLIWLPRPIQKLTITGGWKFDQYDVPLETGTYTYDGTERGCSISIRGNLLRNPGEVDEEDPCSGSNNTEFDMFAAWENLKANLYMTDENDSYDFFISYNPDSDPVYYRKFKSVIPVSWGIDVGDDDRNPFPYTLNLFARNPTIRNTAPGVA